MTDKINEKDLVMICKDAELRHLRRGDAILCKAGKGKDTPFFIPLLNDGDVCVATTFYNTGHVNPDACYETDKMLECEYKRS